MSVLFLRINQRLSCEFTEIKIVLNKQYPTKVTINRHLNPDHDIPTICRVVAHQSWAGAALPRPP